MSESNIFFTEPVDLAQKGIRLDKFLVLNFKDMSRSQIQRLIEQGMVSLDDDTIIDNAFKVRIGDIYQLDVPEAVEADPLPEDIALDVVYEDDDLIVINKPSGMVVHPASGAYTGTLVNALLFHCKDNLSGIGGVKRPGIVHRIDKDTSGLLVVAKNDITHRGLSEQFFDHSIERTYFAITGGVPNPMNGKIEGNIGRSPYDRQKMAILQRGGKTAATNYKTLKVYGNIAALVQCNLETGRTHQIRVHLSSIGCGLIGDQVYGKNKKITAKNIDENVRNLLNDFPRQALHAASLGFVHPVKKIRMDFSCKVPADMENLIFNLEKI